MIKDITGQRFGRLTVLGDSGKRFHRSIVWHCRCDCGKELDVPSTYLQNGQVQNCDDCRVKEPTVKRMRKPKDISKMVFGELTAICPTDKRVSGCVVWECKCSCGNTAYVASYRLLNGNTQSCGHLRRDLAHRNRYRAKDITGHRSGRLVADHRVGRYQDNGAQLWLCKCDCGGTRICLAGQITSEVVKSCGCARKISKSTAYKIACPLCGKAYQVDSLENAPQFCPDCSEAFFSKQPPSD